MKIYVLLIFLWATNFAFAQTAAEKKFLNGYKDLYKTTTTVQKSGFDENTPLKTEGLEQISRHRLKSKKPVENRTYLQFSLTVYQYDSARTAQTAFDEFRQNLEEGFYKAPEYLLLLDKKVYWLGGACLYSKENWGKIETELQNSLFGEDTESEPDGVVKILCGGTIEKSS